VSSRCRASWIAAAVIAFTGVAVAGPVPPDKAAASVPAQPESKSPCTFDVDAQWLSPLKATSAKSVRIKVPHPVNCEGAVVKAITATGKDNETTLQFAVDYKPGHDRAAFISYAIVHDNRNAGVGEVQDTLVAGQTSQLSGSFTIKSREFDRIFASSDPPILRITVRMGAE
jgi:hypothetical protein